MKRLFDIVVSGGALIVLAPILIACALAVRLSSPGPVFFRQVRVGRFGHPFNMLKFRSMRVAGDAAAPQITIGRDPRITPTGHFLRNWKLDELPQLWNVLVGEMSIVGPRPEVPKYVATYPQVMRELVLSVRPGITDPCSIYLRDESEILGREEDPERFYVGTLLPEKLRISGDYVRNRSFTSDLRIILQTAVAVVRR